MLSQQAVNDDQCNAWMTDVVILLANGSIIFGDDYDCYGNVGTLSLTDLQYEGEGFVLYHRACWEVLGKPSYADTETKPARSSADQGWFFHDLDHAIAKPLCPEDIRLRHYDGASMTAGREARAAAAKAERDRVFQAFKPLCEWHAASNSELCQTVKDRYAYLGEMSHDKLLVWLLYEIEARERARLRQVWEDNVGAMPVNDPWPPEPVYDSWAHLERLQAEYPDIFGTLHT